jgi:transposase
MKPLVSDALWERAQPLLPPPRRRFRFPGRKVLTGIRFVLKTGIAWDELPAELGCGKTCKRSLRQWHWAGVLAQHLRRRLDRLTERQEAFLHLACALICLRFLGL